MAYQTARALELLQLGTQNPAATFREGQEAAIQHVVNGLGRMLVVQRTGWGKSFVYFIAARLLREAGAGPAILVSPLLALMRNQIAAAERMGVRAFTINSENQGEWHVVEAALARNEVDILLIAPERLANEHFRSGVLAPVAARISLLVVDEAHCISDWGHDFRPHYRFIERIVRTMPSNLRVLATTATANNRVLADLQTVLGPNLTVSRGDLGRPSLLLQTMRIPSQAGRMGWLATHVPNIPGSGIIYTLTVRDAVQVAGWLQSRGIRAESYTGETGGHRVELEQALLQNRVKALVATTALGMGFDKPDLGFVIHYQTPGSVVAYYQQVGRAGRALATAHGVLLSGQEERDINDYFIESAFPSREEVGQRAVGAASGCWRTFHQRNNVAGEREPRADRKGAATDVAGVPRAHCEDRQQVDAHDGEPGGRFLGARRTTDVASPRGAAADARIRRSYRGSHGVLDSCSRRESRQSRAAGHYSIARDSGTSAGTGSCGISPSHESAAGATPAMADRRAGAHGRDRKNCCGISSTARSHALRLGRRRLGRSGAAREVRRHKICRSVGRGVRGDGPLVGASTGTDLGYLHSVAPPCRSRARLCAAACLCLEFPVPSGAAENRRPTGAEANGEQQSASPECGRFVADSGKCAGWPRVACG
jgi:RecQ family ATP-dependent DNA helicase